MADGEERKKIFAALDKLMRLNVQLPEEHTAEDLHKLATDALHAFYEEFADHQAFLQYFKREWAGKVGELSLLSFQLCSLMS